MSLPMTWKSYVLTGAGLVATWFAAATPSRMPVNVVPEQPREAANVVAATSDIEQQAAHLQARLQQEPLYREPARNLFRFAERRAARAVTPPPIAEPQAALPLPPPVKLSGIAEEGSDASFVRTAIVNTPGGLVFVHEGDEVIGQYRVAKIEADAVELTAVADGTSLKLSLRNP